MSRVSKARSFEIFTARQIPQVHRRSIARRMLLLLNISIDTQSEVAGCQSRAQGTVIGSTGSRLVVSIAAIIQAALSTP
jgi:hypothetical protein